MIENGIPVQGIFWVIDGELLACPYDSVKYPDALAKSQNTYVHKKLWDYVKPQGCNKPYNYYPRGRVNITHSGKVQIYISPHIGEDMLLEIKCAFGVSGNAEIRYDRSLHYKCFLDEEWRKENG